MVTYMKFVPAFTHLSDHEYKIPANDLILTAPARLFSVDRRREAYATILHSVSEYVCSAIQKPKAFVKQDQPGT
jgi:hypothetical protein